MKLSEMNNDKAFDAIIEITPFFSNILEDERLLSIWYDKVDITGLDEKQGKIKGATKGFSNILKIAPLLLKDHREDIFNILAIVNDKTVEDIRNQNPIKTMKQLKELWEDKELLNF